MSIEEAKRCFIRQPGEPASGFITQPDAIAFTDVRRYLASQASRALDTSL